MGSFNPGSPTILGGQWQPSQARNLVLSTGVQAVAMRMRPGAVTPADLDAYLKVISGTPGLALEIVDTLVPTLDVPVTVFPGTDAGAAKSSWVDEAAGASAYTDVNKKTVASTYLVNNTQALAELSFRGATAISAGKRIVSVQGSVNIAYPQATVPGQEFFFYVSSGQSQFAPVDLVVNIGGTLYALGGGSTSPLIPYIVNSSPQVWLNPATKIPWTLTEVNAITNGTDRFGIQKRASTFTGEHRIQGLWLTVQTCPENRRACYYTTTGQTQGWQRYVLVHPDGGAIGALSANTWYWVVVYVLNAAGGSSITLPVLGDPDLVLAASASATGHHRVAYDCGLDRGIVTAATMRTGEMIPMLLENPAGTFNDESQPYVALGTDATDRAQQITAAAGTTYGGVRFNLGWATPTEAPDAALYVEVRHGAGAETGGGTLDAIATIPVTHLTNGALNDVQVPFAASFVSAAVQYYVYFRSTATKPWAIGYLDTDSATVSTITTAQVEGTTQGATTDSYVDDAGAQTTRYDFGVALIPTTAAPSGLASSLLAAV